MKKTIYSTILICFIFITGCKNKDVLVGHAYRFKYPYADSVSHPDSILARTLFIKEKNGWKALPNGKAVGNTPEDLQKSSQLYPKEITWNIFKTDNTFLGKQTSKNPYKFDWWYTIGSFPINIDEKYIKRNEDGYEGSFQKDDLLLCTEKCKFYKYEIYTNSDTDIFEKLLSNNSKYIELMDNYNKSNSEQPLDITKKVSIYDISDGSKVAIFLIKYDGPSSEEFMYGGVYFDSFFSYNKGKWSLIFTTNDYNQTSSNIALLSSIKLIADFDNNKKKDYLIISSKGFILWEEDMKKPISYEWFAD